MRAISGKQLYASCRDATVKAASECSQAVDRSSLTMLIPYAPDAPDVLVLPIVTYWDGTPCTDTRLHGVVTLGAEAEGLCLTAALPHQASPCIPATPPYTRVANLWEYDVVECFIVGAEGYRERIGICIFSD